MRQKKLIAVCAVALTVAVVAFLFADSRVENAVLKLPDGRAFTYAGITKGTPAHIPNPEYPHFFDHQLSEEPSLFWKLAQTLPLPLRSRIDIPKKKWLGSEACIVDQAIWFTSPTAKHDDPCLFFITDDRGYETQVEWAELQDAQLFIPAVAPRRGKFLRISIRASSPFQLGGPLGPPIATATIRNRLTPTGPPLVERDPLPATKQVGPFEVTLKRVVQHQAVSTYTGGLEIDWEVRRNGVRCPEWEFDELAGSFSDGSGNWCLARVESGGSPGIFGSALFSDDPVWRIKLRFRRTDENKEDYDPIIRISDLPVPALEHKVALNRVIEAPPWRVELTNMDASYSAAHHKNMISLSAKVTPPPREGVVPRVLKSETNCFAEMLFDGEAQWYFDLPDDPNLKTWSMDLGLDEPLEVEFQSRVEFEK